MLPTVSRAILEKLGSFVVETQAADEDLLVCLTTSGPFCHGECGLKL